MLARRPERCICIGIVRGPPKPHYVGQVGNLYKMKPLLVSTLPDRIRFVTLASQRLSDACHQQDYMRGSVGNAEPGAAIEALIKRNPAADPALETERLQMAIDANVLTDYVKENGMGGIDADRMASAIEQTKSVYEFQTAPDMAIYFDPSYLPTDGSLMLKYYHTGPPWWRPRNVKAIRSKIS